MLTKMDEWINALTLILVKSIEWDSIKPITIGMDWYNAHTERPILGRIRIASLKPR